MTTTTASTEQNRPQIGDHRMGYDMQPCGADGRPLNHGMSYANADTIADARAYADRVLTSNPAVHSVQITGELWELGYQSWARVTGADALYESFTVRS